MHTTPQHPDRRAAGSAVGLATHSEIVAIAIRAQRLGLDPWRVATALGASQHELVALTDELARSGSPRRAAH